MRRHPRNPAAMLMVLMTRIVVNPTTGCYLWEGSTSGETGRGKGYAKISWCGMTWYVHVLSYCLSTGDWAIAGWQVDHKCRNRLRIRQEHLEKVTNIENQRRKPK